jgi:hypothetical protein
VAVFEHPINPITTAKTETSNLFMTAVYRGASASRNSVP